MNSWLSKLKVATRMYLAFGAMVGLVAASLIAGWLQSRSHDADMQRLVDDNLRKLQLIERWVALSESTSVRILAVSSTSDPALGALFGPEIGPRVKEVGEMFKQVDALSTTPEERAEIEALVPTRKRLLATLGKVNELRAQGSAEAASALVKSDFAPVVQEYSAHLRKYAELQGKLMHQAVAQSREEGQRRALTLAALVALGLAVVSATVALTVRRLSATVDLAVETAQRVSRGDLTARPRVEGADELATLMRTLGDMAGSLEALVIDVRSGTASISVASSEIAQGNTDLSVRTEQQSANLQMAASAMEQMTSTVAQTADNARQAAAMAQEASAVATSGGQAVEQVVATMAQIQSASRRIAEIVGVIDGIAFQTNILALNAAVEAARAGEQGRGFAVVAAEVRTLAGRSAEAAREIKSLIADSSEKVDAGHAQVGEAGRRMAEIVSSVRRVSHLIAEISTASGEQNGGIVAVGRSVSEIEQATQQNAALVEQAAAAAGSMKSQAQRLEQAVSVFHVSAPA